ncbi:ABC transporter substrate-binding protein [Anaerobacillus sp. MEB173]|uniref:ABC transporter substrate-binding protein n=1 Tax=Anaerobacillus sp. MEB173 TaxID=3383345 RepID=UPI003F924A14
MKKKLLFSLIISFIVTMLIACSQTSNSTDTSQSSGSESEGGSTEISQNTEPVEIRFGGGYATEETLWLLDIAGEDLAPNKGKSYTLNISQFRANADRLNAYQAGQLDAGSLGQGASMLAHAQGIDLKVVTVMSKDTPDVGFNTSFMALEESEIESIEDLKGKTIGISDFRAPADLWTRSALRSAGLDPDKDVKFAITPIPAMTEAVKSKRIDVGMFPQPFFAEAEASGEFKTIFTSKTGIPLDEDFLVIFFDPTFITENENAVRDFLADYKAVVDYYVENGEEARQMIIDAGKVQADPAIYLSMEDNNRSVYLDIEGWEAVQEIMVNDGWLDAPFELNELLDTSLLPAQ